MTRKQWYFSFVLEKFIIICTPLSLAAKFLGVTVTIPITHLWLDSDCI